LRKLARLKLPEELFKLRKSGFGPSLKEMISSKEVKELLTGKKTIKRGIINVKQIKSKLDSNKFSNSEMMQFLNFAFIEQWHRTYID
jgi:hypothetical protein